MAPFLPAAGRPMATQRSLRRFTLTSGPVDLRLEAELWASLTAIANDRRLPLASLIDAIDQQRGQQPLSRALWRFAIAYIRALAELADTLPAPTPVQKRPALTPIG